MTLLEIHMDETAAALTSDVLAGNPLMKHDPVYALSPETISVLCSEGVIASLPARHEKELSDYCVAAGAVGLWQGVPIQYSLLRDPKREFSGLERIVCEYLEYKRDFSQRDYVISELQARWLPQQEQQRGYAGWLSVNRDFQAELATFIDRWNARIDHHGLPVVGSSGRGMLFHPGGYLQSRVESTYLAEYCVFCRRWRLAGFATPDLPTPVPNHSTLEPPYLTAWHRHMGGGGMHFADVYAIPARDQFQRIVRDLQAHSHADHLAEWVDIVHRRSKDRVGPTRYGHALAVRHFWRVIRSRYAGEIMGKTEAVDRAIGKGLQLSEETIRQTRLMIENSLAP